MFIQWADGLKDQGIKKEIISIDGKCIRGSKDTFHAKSPIHMVSAWASQNQLVLGQLKVDEKSNEITAIPLLLDLLDISGSIISIDAMGTQTAIAKKIIENKADYILSVKNNQKDLLQQIEGRFGNQNPDSISEVIEKGHVHIETRRCEVITNLTFVDNSCFWAGLKSIIKITSKRVEHTKESTEVRYYISSLFETAPIFNSSIRAHWGIENRLYWTLDMVFDEDGQRKRNKNAANNFSLIRKIALNLLKKDKSKASMVTKRLKAGWDDQFLLEILNQI